MKFKFGIILFLSFASCSHEREPKLVKTAETSFRITRNFPDREWSDKELDSIENTLPFHIAENKKNMLFDRLEKGGFVQNEYLDTTGMQFSLITWENPSVRYADIQLSLDTTGGVDRIITKLGKTDLTAELGPSLLGDIFVSYIDIDNDESPDLLVMTKYYVMGGYNFDLNLFQFQ